MYNIYSKILLLINKTFILKIFLRVYKFLLLGLKYLSTVDHKSIGILYILFGVGCGFFGAYLSSLIRTELLVPGYFLFSGSEVSYNITVTTHGLIMVFFATMPIFISGLGNYMIPLMVGCRDMALPRLNNLAFYLLFFSFLVFLLANGLFSKGLFGVSSGWTLYPPLSILKESSSIDLLIISLHLNGISSLINAVNTIITVHFFSSLSLWHLNSFVWSLFITSFLVLMVMPVLVVAITTLLSDHLLSTCFYSVSGGGDPVLFQHIFWFFGHPEVYILILPAFGLVSEVLAEHSSIRLIGYKIMVWSMVSIAILGCFVWGHHMFTAGMELDSKCYFTIATTLIAIPTGLKVLIWLSTFLNKDVYFNIPVSFSFLFILTFIFGGFTGIWLAQVGLDLLLHDTYFVVGHFHYVMAISLVYMFFAFIYNWSPLVTGVMYNETFARVHLITFFIGSNLLFLPMHFLGISGMPRRVFDYPSCFIFWNQLSSLGFFIIEVSLIWFLLALTPICIFKRLGKEILYVWV